MKFLNFELLCYSLQLPREPTVVSNKIGTNCIYTITPINMKGGL